jgi:hypothetical protein
VNAPIIGPNTLICYTTLLDASRCDISYEKWVVISVCGRGVEDSTKVWGSTKRSIESKVGISVGVKGVADLAGN